MLRRVVERGVEHQFRLGRAQLRDRHEGGAALVLYEKAVVLAPRTIGADPKQVVPVIDEPGIGEEIGLALVILGQPFGTVMPDQPL